MNGYIIWACVVLVVIAVAGFAIVRSRHGKKNSDPEQDIYPIF